MILMKAIVYTRYGAPEVLEIKEIEKPEPVDDEILIRIHAVEATKADCELRSFNFAVKWFWLPLRVAMGMSKPIAVKWFWLPLRVAMGMSKPKKQVLGGYFAGEVETIGKDVSKFKKGDQVFGTTRLLFGAYGEYVCLPANYTIMPKTILATMISICLLQNL